MPVDKLKVLKKAAEVNEIESRLAFISDLNAAFFANGEHVKTLQKVKNELVGQSIIMKAEPDWVERLKKFQK